MAVALKELKSRGVEPGSGAYMVPHRMITLPDGRCVVLFGTNQVESISIVHNADESVIDRVDQQIDSIEF